MTKKRLNIVKLMIAIAAGVGFFGLIFAWLPNVVDATLLTSAVVMALGIRAQDEPET